MYTLNNNYLYLDTLSDLWKRSTLVILPLLVVPGKKLIWNIPQEVQNRTFAMGRVWSYSTTTCQTDSTFIMVFSGHVSKFPLLCWKLTIASRSPHCVFLESTHYKSYNSLYFLFSYRLMPMQFKMYLSFGFDGLRFYIFNPSFNISF